MNIKDVSDFLKNLINESNDRSELKVYQKFLAVLSDLKNKDLDDYQFQSIDEKLDSFQLETNVENRKKYIRGKLNLFLKYLKDDFDFVSDGYYTGIGMALGMAFGVSIGSATEIGTGIAIGLAIGLALGAAKDADMKKKGRVLNVKLD